MNRRTWDSMFLSRSVLVAMLIAGSTALSGCYSDDRGGANSGSASATVSKATYPVGVLADGADRASIKGVYPSVGEDACCWAGPDVTFRVLSDDAAKEVHVKVYEPKIGPFEKRQQTVSIVDRTGRAVASKTIGIGATTVVFALPRGSVSHGVATVRLRMGTAFVPKEVGFNNDPRTLAVVLQSVDTR